MFVKCEMYLFVFCLAYFTIAYNKIANNCHDYTTTKKKFETHTIW